MTTQPRDPREHTVPIPVQVGPTPPTAPHQPGHPRRRKIVIALITALAVLVLAISLRPSGAAPGLDPSGAAVVLTTDTLGGTATDDAAESQLDGADDSSGLTDTDTPPPVDGGGGEPGGDGAGVEIPPVAPPDAGPCSGYQPGNGAFWVHPDPVVLPAGDRTGTIYIVNCGPAERGWTATVNPKVTLEDTDGSLVPQQTAVIGFTIDFDAYGDGAISFKIKVAEVGANHYIDVAAYNPLLGSESVAGGGLSAGADAGGCATQCITKALLRPNATTPNVGLQIGTTTPAYLSVFVSTDPPVIGPNGPVFAGVAPMDHTDDLRTGWTARLAPLAPDTTYYVIVRAIDADGDRAFRHGSFHTRTPVQGPGGLAQPGGPAGCAAQCITKAWLSPAGGAQAGTTVGLDVASHTPAQFQASVSTQAPTLTDGVPSFAQTVEWANSGLQYAKTWQVDLSGLTPGTDYHIIVAAQDAQGRKAWRVGQFRTVPAPDVDLDLALVSVRVDRDGDGIGRGELSMGWRIGEHTVATFGEAKREDGDLVTFGTTPTRITVPGMSGWLPVVRVAAMERDPDGLSEFCAGPAGVPDSQGSNGACDVKWNVAASGLVKADQLDGLAACETVPTGQRFAGYRCMEFASAANGDDYPSITAVVAIRVS